MDLAVSSATLGGPIDDGRIDGLSIMVARMPWSRRDAFDKSAAPYRVTFSPPVGVLNSQRASDEAGNHHPLDLRAIRTQPPLP